MNIGQLDISPSITAAGTTQATATLIVNSLVYIGTAAAGSGVRLAVLNSGAPQVVYNAGANAVYVYPPTGVQINGLPANLPHLLAPNTTCVFWTYSTTQIIGILSA